MDSEERAYFEKQSEKHGETLDGIHGRLDGIIKSVAGHSTRIAVIETKHENYVDAHVEKHKGIDQSITDIKEAPDKILSRTKAILWIIGSILGLLGLGGCGLIAQALLGA